MTFPSVTDDAPFGRPWHRAGLGVAALLLAAAVATATFQAGHGGGRSPGSTPLPTVDAAQPQPQDTLGAVDAPADELIVGDTIAVAGWALDPAGVRAIEIRVDGRAYPARFGLPRPDVAALKPGYPDGVANGFAFEGHIPGLTPQRHDLAVVAIAKDGRETVLARKGLVPAAALRMWSDLLDARPALAAAPFSFLMMTSGLAVGGAGGIDTQYRGYPSRTQRVGMAIPVLYMRATRGAAGDWVFDPEFDLTRKCGTRSVVDDNLGSVIRHAVRHALPVQFILNGGIWGDASCNTPEWDLNDHLEEDRNNCQWTQRDEVLPDDFLRNLPGSMQSPELARSLTYNVYATKVRNYKRRNLQAATAIIAQFAREHPALFLGIVLDADTYMNPFVRNGRWYDYNPDMLKQFRHWLRGSGPYAGSGTQGTPDLRSYRRARPLSLAAVNRLARQQWKSWDEVDPPRSFPGDERAPVPVGQVPFWEDSWHLEWDSFRKHIVALHYSELSSWVHAMGIPRDKIFSAQAFSAPDAGMRPVSLYIHGGSPDYDSAGVSIEGAIPRQGRLGAILYGPAAENRHPMEDGRSLFSTLARMAPGWGIVEHNATDLKRPDIVPEYAQSYHTFRDSFNFDGSQISAMAWNGSNGLFVGQPGYVPYTSWRNTPAEDAMRDYLVSHTDVPRGARLWTFGTARHAADDGWTAQRGALVAGRGHLTLTAADGVVTIDSPRDLVVRPHVTDLLALHVGDARALEEVTVHARVDGDSAWHPIGNAAQSTRVPLRWPAAWQKPPVIATDLRITLTLAAGANSVRLDRVLLYPAAAAMH